MLVLLSDFRITDGTSGETINPKAFEKFKNILIDIIGEKEPDRNYEEWSASLGYGR